MALMVNEISLLRGETNSVLTLLNNSLILKHFSELRDALASMNDLSELNDGLILSAFMEIIKSEETTGPVTQRALATVEKFVRYGLLHKNTAQTVAEGIVRSTFVSTGNDECVFLQILHTLRTLIRSFSPLPDDTICEILQCCFRIGLDSTLSVLLRTAAESIISEIVQVLFDYRLFKASAEHTAEYTYGLPSVKELLKFLSALINPHDTSNSSTMILMGLNLLSVALESGVDYFEHYLFLPLVKNEMFKNLLQLLDTSELQIFTAVNRVCIYQFESLRKHLKFQLEAYCLKLFSIINNEQTNYKFKEMALESLNMLCRIPGVLTELYLNYDCSLYCSNLFEDLTQLLLHNAFPVGGLRSTHILSLDTLLAVVDTIDRNCAMRQADVLHNLMKEDGASDQPHSAVSVQLPYATAITIDEDAELVHATSHLPACMNVFERNKSRLNGGGVPSASPDLPPMSEVIDRKKRKKLVAEGTELFNTSPTKGIQFLSEKGILQNPIDPTNVALWLRTNPRLDKNKIAEYICNRKHLEILKAFVSTFQFEHLRLDESLRRFLETFRLPGESAEITKIMQEFSDHWYKANNEPFGHVDAAFTLSYAVIMLNVDQHNPQARRSIPPMTFESFKRNLQGINDGKDFDEEMLLKIYTSIKKDEIVMPAEQTGLVKENYLWKVLLRRGETEEGVYLHAPVGWNDRDLFGIVWGAATAALSYAFDKSFDESILTKALTGYRKCASIAAYYGMTNVFDNLIIHLCKFSTLMTLPDESINGTMMAEQNSALTKSMSSSVEMIPLTFAEDLKAQMAIKIMFHLVHKHGDNLREGWKNVLDCVLHLYRAQLLPPKLVEVEDYIDPKGVISIQRVYNKKAKERKQETSILTWLGFYSGDNSGRRPSLEQEELRKKAKTAIADCHPEQLIADSKYLTSSALKELIGSVIHASQQIGTVGHLPSSGSSDVSSLNDDGSAANPADRAKLSSEREDSMIFLLEMLISVVLENRDRLCQVWPDVKAHLHFILSSFDHNQMLTERTIVGLLRVANAILFRPTDDKTNVEDILLSLVQLLQLQPPIVEEVGVRAVQLVAKIFLHHLTTLSESAMFSTIIKQLIAFMKYYYTAGQEFSNGLLSEAIPEAMKNLVLVMKNCQLLSDELNALISTEISTFLPNLMGDCMN